MIRKTIVLASAVAALAVPGCGGPASFVGSNSTEVVYLQWQQSSSGDLTGTITDDQLTGTPPDESLSTDTASFTGNVSNGSVSITAEGFLGINATLTGTLSGGTLSLQVPASDGTIQTDTFNSAGVSTFNADVAGLRRAAGRANGQALAAQKQAQQQQADQQAEQTASSDLSAVSQDAGKLPGDLSQIASDVATENGDLTNEKHAASHGPNADGGGCYNLTQNVDYDATQNVEYDQQQNVGYDVTQNLEPDISAVRSDVSAAENDLATLQSDGLPAPGSAASTISGARSAIASAIATANGYIGQANADVTEAYAVANGIATGSCSGQGPGSPQGPLPPVS